MRRNNEVMVSFRFTPLRLAAIAALGLGLSACATAYSDRTDESGNSLKGLATMSGLAMTVPDAKDFVKASRSDRLDYIPIEGSATASQSSQKPLTPEELLLLQKKLDAAGKQNGAAAAKE